MPIMLLAWADDLCSKGVTTWGPTLAGLSFLNDAHQEGVLRQAGAVYQFRHKDLQHRLATSPEPVRNRRHASTAGHSKPAPPQ
jgi:hypothetical protein